MEVKLGNMSPNYMERLAHVCLVWPVPHLHWPVRPMSGPACSWKQTAAQHPAGFIPQPKHFIGFHTLGLWAHLALVASVGWILSILNHIEDSTSEGSKCMYNVSHVFAIHHEDP